MDDVDELDPALQGVSEMQQLLAGTGAYDDCIALREKAAELKTRIHGADSEPVLMEKLAAAELHNSLAMQLIYSTNNTTNTSARSTGTTNPLERAKTCLTMAEMLTEPHPHLTDTRKRLEVRSTTYNNFVVLSKKEKKYRTALQYAHRALKIQNKYNMLEAKAASQLNIAALLSTLGKHQQAYRSAESALDTVMTLEDQRAHQESMGMGMLNSPSPPLSLEASDDDPTLMEGGIQIRDRIYYAPLQVMCYTNMGTELEHLERWDACGQSYQAAYQLAYMAMGPTHPLTTRCKQSFVDVYRKQQQVIDSQQKPVMPNRHVSLHELTTPMTTASSLRRSQCTRRRFAKAPTTPSSVPSRASVSGRVSRLSDRSTAVSTTTASTRSRARATVR